MDSRQKRQVFSFSFSHFLKVVEKLGNLLPHPVTLFVALCALVLLVAQYFDYLDLSVIDPRDKSGQTLIHAKGLLSPEGLRLIFPNIVTNFSHFAPLGTVLVTMLAVGVAESSGLLSAMIRALVLKAPKRLITFSIAFAGILSNTASELGYVVLIPLGGFLFLTQKRHPLAGMACAFAAVSGGYSANLFIGTVDPLLSGITQEAARLVDPQVVTHPAMNWYFMVASTFLIALLTTLITEKIVEPNLGTYDPKEGDIGPEESKITPLSSIELKGLFKAVLVALALTLLILFLVVPEQGLMRDPITGSPLRSPFMKSMVAWIFILFFFPSLIYAKSTNRLQGPNAIIHSMGESMAKLGPYLVLVFFAAQFIALFKWTNLGAIVAIKGATFLKDLQITGPLIFFPFILLCGFINLMLGSASAQWAVTAPIFVPMLMMIGYSPDIIQAAYRIGDSTTNIITPMMSYFGLILAFAEKFKRDIKIGTIISTMIPYSLTFMLIWSILFYLWVFVFHLPVGPDTSIYYTLKPQ